MARSGITDSISVPAIGVKTVATEKLFANPYNPRMLFDDAPMKVLRESIERVGILVPLAVYREAATGNYVILDGQRRWIVAQELGLKQVPVNEIAEPSVVQNIVTMFQIHKLREDWELMPTALKLEVLMKELQERNVRKLAVLTGLEQAVVVRCKKLLDFPRKYQELMLLANPRSRHKADFFIELYAVRNDRFVNSLEWYSRNSFTDAMLLRYENKQGLKAVTDFRRMKQLINNARKAGFEDEIDDRLREFVEDPELPLSHLEFKQLDVATRSMSVESNIEGLITTLRDIDVNDFYGQENFWKLLEDLHELILRKLRDADRRLRNRA